MGLLGCSNDDHIEVVDNELKQQKEEEDLLKAKENTSRVFEKLTAIFKASLSKAEQDIDALIGKLNEIITEGLTWD